MIDKAIYQNQSEFDVKQVGDAYFMLRDEFKQLLKERQEMDAKIKKVSDCIDVAYRAMISNGFRLEQEVWVKEQKDGND